MLKQEVQRYIVIASLTRNPLQNAPPSLRAVRYERRGNPENF